MKELIQDTDGDAAVGIEIENLGGIDFASRTITPGVTVLSGKNATNRTSFLEAVATGLGGSYSSVKSGESEGSVTLTFPDGSGVTRTVSADSGSPVASGEKLVSTPDDVAPFAWLFMNNEIRQAIRAGETERLASLAMRPVDTAEIDAETQRLKQQRDTLDGDIKDAEATYEQSAAIQADITALEDELTDTEADLEQLEVAIEEADEVNEELQELESTLDDLTTEKSQLESQRDKARTKHENLQQRIADQKDSRTELKESIESAQEELEQIDGDPDEFQRKRQEIQAQIEELDGTQSAIDTVIGFTQGVLNGEHDRLRQRLTLADDTVEPSEMDEAAGNGLSALEQQLGEGNTDVEESMRCWTCGATTTVGTVETQVSLLREQRMELETEKSELHEELQTAQDKEEAYDSAQRRLTQLENNLSGVKDAISQLESEVDDAESDVAALTDEIEALEEEIASYEEEIQAADDSDTEIVELRDSRRQKEAEVNRIEGQLAQRQTDLEEAKQAKKKAEALREEREEIQEELTALRDRVDELEDAVVTRFNEHMDDLVSLLDYQNIERVSITKKRISGETAFDLELVRETGDGTVTADTLTNLSESEREVVSIAFSLAGYLAHDIGDEMPVVLMDSIEMIDGARINDLLDYFEESAEYVLVALLEEDAEYITVDSGEAIEFTQSATGD